MLIQYLLALQITSHKLWCTFQMQMILRMMKQSQTALEVMRDQAAAVCDDIADLLEVAMQRANARLETERTILQKVERK